MQRDNVERHFGNTVDGQLVLLVSRLGRGLLPRRRRRYGVRVRAEGKRRKLGRLRLNQQEGRRHREGIGLQFLQGQAVGALEAGVLLVAIAAAVAVGAAARGAREDGALAPRKLTVVADRA